MRASSGAAARLRRQIDRIGLETLVENPGLSRNVFADVFPDDQLAASLLLAAIETGAVRALVHRASALPESALRPRLVAEIAASRGIGQAHAEWAIETWAAVVRGSDDIIAETVGAPEVAPTTRVAPSATRRPTPVGSMATLPNASVLAPPRAARVRRFRFLPVILTVVGLAVLTTAGLALAAAPRADASKIGPTHHSAAAHLAAETAAPSTSAPTTPAALPLPTPTVTPTSAGAQVAPPDVAPTTTSSPPSPAGLESPGSVYEQAVCPGLLEAGDVVDAKAAGDLAAAKRTAGVTANDNAVGADVLLAHPSSWHDATSDDIAQMASHMRANAHQYNLMSEADSMSALKAITTAPSVKSLSTRIHRELGLPDDLEPTCARLEK